MNKRTIIASLLISIIFFGCENTTEVELNIENEEYIVVQAMLEGGKDFKGVSFTKTLPLGMDYDIKSAELQDVKAYLKVNEVQIIPLHYANNGVYKPKHNLKIVHESTYELLAFHKGRNIYSKTYVPAAPVVNEANYNSDYYLTADITPKGNTAYGATWFINELIGADDFHSIISPDNNSSLTVRTQYIPTQYRSANYRDKTNIIVFAFDISYRNYFNTRGSSFESGDSFTEVGSGNVVWNVQGKNVIGLFTGFSKSDTTNTQ